MVEERRLKDGAISKAEFAMEKVSKYSQKLTESREAKKRTL